jgi:WD40 repeat protein
MIATGGWDNKIKLWSVETPDWQELVGHKNLVLSVAFAPDGKLLASGSTDQTVRLWQVPSGIEVRRMIEEHANQ